MSSFFSMDSPLYKFMNRLLDMIKLNVLWLLCSGVAAKFIIEGFIVLSGFGAYRIFSWIPMILIGPATTAAFAITIRMVDEEEGYIAKPFFDAYRDNFKQGMALGVILLVAVYAIYLDFQFYAASQSLGRNSVGYMIIGIIAIFMTYMHLTYAFALQSRYENTVVNTMRNSYSILAKFFPRAIFLFVVLVVEYFVVNLSSTTQFFGVLIGPACIILTISGFAKQAFRLVENENADRENGVDEDEEEEDSLMEDEEMDVVDDNTEDDE